MLPLIAVLLAATPTAPRPSLLQPEPGRYLSARLLVAQAHQETPTPPPLPVSEEVDLDARIQVLTRQVGLLNDEIRGISTDWPTSSLVMAICGYVLSPMLLLGVPLMVLSALASTEGDDTGQTESLLAAGLGLTVAGLAGVGLVVGGVVTGVRASSVQRARRSELVSERIRLETELRDLKARRDMPRTRRWEPRPTVPLLAVRF
jgi:hypothetical protein